MGSLRRQAREHACAINAMCIARHRRDLDRRIRAGHLYENVNSKFGARAMSDPIKPVPASSCASCNLQPATCTSSNMRLSESSCASRFNLRHPQTAPTSIWTRPNLRQPLTCDSLYYELQPLESFTRWFNATFVPSVASIPMPSGNTQPG